MSDSIDTDPREQHDAQLAAGPGLALVRYGELALKGRNRGQFEQTLVRNVKRALAPLTEVRVERLRGRLAVFPERRREQAVRRLAEVFGIKSVSPAWSCARDPEAIVALARAVLGDVLADLPPGARPTFRVQSSRADKTFPLTSVELDRFVAERILREDSPVRIELDDPELVLGIDVRPERAYVYSRRLPGPGGLPVGTLGRALCLLSGGIDSPVAAWLAMKRGCEVSFVSFHSYPFLGEASKRKVVDLARHLARYQPRTRLFVVPFTEVQVAIRDAAPEAYRTVLYRRMMQRIASRLAERDRCGALVTGECLGQVASQTLENLTRIQEASSLPVLRPLIAFDKEETITLARRIGTFELSARPEPDCCTVFQPRHPVIRGRAADCARAEAGLDLAGLVTRALEGVEILDFTPE